MPERERQKDHQSLGPGLRTQGWWSSPCHQIPPLCYQTHLELVQASFQRVHRSRVRAHFQTFRGPGPAFRKPVSCSHQILHSQSRRLQELPQKHRVRALGCRTNRPWLARVSSRKDHRGLAREHQTDCLRERQTHQ